MNNFKQWFKNLNKPSHTVMVRDYESFQDPFELKYNFAQLDIKHLQRALAHALSERKTCTANDFYNQLHVVLEANAAVVQQKLLGAQSNSQVAQVTEQHLREEMAKLKFLVFENTDITAEAAAKRVEEYLEYHKDKRGA